VYINLLPNSEFEDPFHHFHKDFHFQTIMESQDILLNITNISQTENQQQNTTATIMYTKVCDNIRSLKQTQKHTQRQHTVLHWHREIHLAVSLYKINMNNEHHDTVCIKSKDISFKCFDDVGWETEKACGL